MKNAIRPFIAFLCMGIVTLAFGISAADAQSRIVNFVHAGGPDVEDPDWEGSGPGFDKNFSLTAFKFSDGTATGTLVDRWAAGVLPGTTVLRAEIDCVHVAGNTAWVSGVVTQGRYIDEFGELDIAGWYVRTRVLDNGRNNDPANPDRIAFSQVRSSAPFLCANMFTSAFLDMPRGQVTIK